MGSIGLLATLEITASSPDPTGTRTLTWTVVAVGGFLLILTAGAWAAVVAAQSRWWQVFSARRTMVCALMLLALAGVLTAALIRRGPLQHVFSTFQIGASDIAGVGLLFAIGACLLTSGVALIEAWDARSEERNWSTSMPAK